MKAILLWGLSVLFLIDSILRAFRSTFNLGTAIMYGITACLWGYTLFYRQVDAFCEAGVGRILKILFFCGCTFVLCMCLFLGIAGHADAAKGDEPVVIVLGAGLRGTQVSGLLARRLNAAYSFWQQNPTALLVVTGGQGPGEAIPEAHAMKAYLLDKGVPESSILVEDKSTSTEENFLFARQLLQARGISSALPMAFSTNQFHCYRAGKYAQHVGFADTRAIPASIGMESILPCYLREVLAVLYYWVFKR